MSDSSNTIHGGPLNLTDGIHNRFSPIRLAIATVPCAIIVAALIDFPVAQVPLALALFVYAALLIYRPACWLVAIPCAIPVLQLAPWSGRILWDEFDLVILTTVATLVARGYYRPGAIGKLDSTTITITLLLTLSYLTSLVIGLFPLESFDTNATNNYTTNYNSLRVFRGFLWTLLLLPLLIQEFRADRTRCLDLWSLGTAIGLFAIGMIVLWERGFLYDLLNYEDKFQLFKRFFDFSTQYRVTAWFADMHTGGAALDAYLVLAIPITGLLLYRRRRHWLMTTFLSLTIGMACYAALVTFTRSTYAALLFATMVGCVLWLNSLRFKLPGNLKLTNLAIFLATIGFLLAVIIIVFLKGGIIATAIAMLSFSTGLLFMPIYRIRRIPAICACVLLLLLFTLELIDQFQSSRWSDNSLALAIGLGIFTVPVCSLCGLTAYRHGLSSFSLRSLGWSSALITICLVIAVPATFSARMSERMMNIDSSASVRSSHWQHNLALIDNGFSSLGFGMGLGQFPKRYLYNSTSTQPAASFAYLAEGEDNFLRLGGHNDFLVGQRLDIAPEESTLTIEARVRTADNLQLALVIARKNINDPRTHNPEWVSRRLQITGQAGVWQTVRVDLDAARINNGAVLEGFPLNFFLRNRTANTTVDIDYAKVFDSDASQLLQNAGFTEGGDHWFFYSDHTHLAWHVKNLWLNLLFEQGWFGLLLVAALFGSALYRLYPRRDNPKPETIAYMAALAGIFVVSLFDSLVDAPRITLLLFLIAYTGILIGSNANDDTAPA